MDSQLKSKVLSRPSVLASFPDGFFGAYLHSDGFKWRKRACILFPPVNNWINNFEEQLLETVDEDVIPELIKWHSN